MTTVMTQPTQNSYSEPQWLTFIKNIAQQVVEQAKHDELEGTVEWDVHSRRRDDNSRVTYVALKYYEEDHESPELHIMAGRDYYGKKMIRVFNSETGSELPMVADSMLLLSYLSYC